MTRKNAPPCRGVFFLVRILYQPKKTAMNPKRQLGFTLIELPVVIAIVAILAVPSMIFCVQGITAKRRSKAGIEINFTETTRSKWLIGCDAR